MDEFDKACNALKDSNGIVYFGEDRARGYIKPSAIEPLPSGQIILNETLLNKFIRLEIDTKNKEIPFVCFGLDNRKNGNENEITILNIIVDSNYSPHRSFADYTTLMQKVREEYEKLKLYHGVIMFVGHTHPVNASFGDYFSLGDVSSLIQTAEIFNEMQVGSLLLAPQISGVTSSYQLKTMVFDRRMGKVYSVNAPCKIREYDSFEYDVGRESQLSE